MSESEKTEHQTLSFEMNNLSYTLIFSKRSTDFGCDTLSIEAVRKDDYSIWHSVIYETAPDSKSICATLANTMFVNYPPETKFRIISDHIAGTLDKMYSIKFPVADTDSLKDETQNLIIEIIMTPVYGNKSITLINIEPKELTFTEKIQKNLSNHKESVNTKIEKIHDSVEKNNKSCKELIEQLTSKIAALETRVADLEDDEEA